ncbi:MAG: hypothetical protein AB1805_02945 [Nitrospirota bacterium]
MDAVKRYSIVIVAIASLVSIYLYWTGPSRIEVTGRDMQQQETVAEPGEAVASGAEGAMQDNLVSQYEASMSGVAPQDIQAVIEKGLQKGNRDITAKLKLTEALYNNNYGPAARDLFNSIGDEEMCRYITEREPDARCEGDLRLVLGETLYREGHLKLTRDILTNLISESITNMAGVEIGAFQTLRMVYRNLGEMVKYEALIESVPEEHPMKPELLKDAAYYYFEEGNPERANHILTLASNRYPDNEALHSYIERMTAVEKVQ